MASVRISKGQVDYVIDFTPPDGARINRLCEADISSIAESIIKSKKHILTELFIADTNERSHKEVAHDLGLTPENVTMMRFQFIQEGRTPSLKRTRILERFYWKGINKQIQKS
jgi:hypothetical protein